MTPLGLNVNGLEKDLESFENGHPSQTMCVERSLSSVQDDKGNSEYKRMVIDKKVLDELTEKSKASPRLRYNLDLRNNTENQLQRMLNALGPGTVMPVHRLGIHRRLVCILGHFEEFFYDSDGRLMETIDMVPGGVVLNIEAGQWHSLKCLESGTILLEAKDGAYEPLGEEKIWNEQEK